ncbi:hypothetical protein Bca52824_062507 [Brassica carinata]|uniref:Uncharacterized protein n=1 Tax=Brassica carinata TaxID=52824 RepID=A0A8X7QCZ9_BRACI|nr:hypothetical protein Bca52824_062507 [Brassica carinata]
MEGLTNLGSFRTYYSVEPSQQFHEDKYLDGSLVPRLETELRKAQSRIKELEREKYGSKENIRSFLRNQRISHEENTDPVVDYLKNKLSKEREERKRANAENAMLKKKMRDMESSVNRLRRERDTLEKVCEELKKWDEKEEERQMLEMAEMWREESVRVKLMDAKLSLEEKYAEMNWFVDELEKCLVMARKVGAEEMKLKRGEGLIKMARSLEDAANGTDLEKF